MAPSRTGSCTHSHFPVFRTVPLVLVQSCLCGFLAGGSCLGSRLVGPVVQGLLL